MCRIATLEHAHDIVRGQPGEKCNVISFERGVDAGFPNRETERAREPAYRVMKTESRVFEPRVSGESLRSLLRNKVAAPQGNLSYKGLSLLPCWKG